MSTYTVQPGDTPMLITQKLLGNPTRMSELVRSNAHKPTVAVGRMVTFRDLSVGEKLTVPPRWEHAFFGKGHAAGGSHRSPSKKRGSAKKHPAPSQMTNRTIVGAHAHAAPGFSGNAYPQPAPHFAVAPRDGGDPEPILVVAGRPGGPGGIPTEGMQRGMGKACCSSCAVGGPCETACEGVPMPACSEPQAPPSIPGSTSFPVGFGQTPSTATSTATTAGDMLSGWGVPLAVGAISIAAGFGLAYVISHK